ncbi:MAG: hypothetical protein HY078_09780 [Elusimicrobia bacterium]|nr:hypothetical protein [Elusimicrobiota bacterium]
MEYQSNRNNNSNLALIAIVLFLLADGGIAFWYWQSRSNGSDEYTQSKQKLWIPSQPQDSPGPLSRLPQPQAQPAHPTDSLNMISNSKSPFGRPQNRPQTQPGQPPAQNQEDADYAGRGGTLDQAAGELIRYQHTPAFRNSKALMGWSREFRSYKDLNKVNSDYWKTRDAMSFVLGTVRSPNFAKMLKKYATSSDLGKAAKDLLYKPAVQHASMMLVKNPVVFNAIKDVTLPGLPSVRVLMAMGDAQEKGKSPLELPEVQQYLQSQALLGIVPPEAMGQFQKQ